MNGDLPSRSDDDDDIPSPDDMVSEALELETQQRLWLRTLIPLLQLRSHDSDPSGRVQLAFDLMHIAACERVSRIVRGALREQPD
jgi:hypothetical protein